MGETEADRLEQYRSMRDFGRTPEPAGGEETAVSGGRFVVQEHHATALHWDVRLEREGVLVSWAVPRGVPADPRQNHLAVHTEDHPMSYLDFEGHIPKGEYGGGDVTIWDTGTYECHKWEDREVIVTLHGQRARGRYVLFQTRGRDWMMHRMDPPEDPGREPMPEGLRPLALPVGDLPTDLEMWSFEAAWGGQRVLVSSQGGRIRVDADEGEVTARWPEVRELGRAMGTVAAVLEGELVVAGEGGQPDADRLRQRLGARSGASARRLAQRAPGVLMVADVVWLEGHSTEPLPYRQRRRLLEQLELSGPAWQTAPSHPGQGETLLQASRDQGLAGVVARRLDGPYEPDHLRFVPA